MNLSRVSITELTIHSGGRMEAPIQSLDAALLIKDMS